MRDFVTGVRLFGRGLGISVAVTPTAAHRCAPSTAQLPWWRLLGWGLRDGVLLVLRSLMFTVPLLIAGFIPVVGQTVVPVLLTLVTAWFLALGLGTPATLLRAIPLAAIIVMPVAFVGGVLVAHETLRDTTLPTE